MRIFKKPPAGSARDRRIVAEVDANLSGEPRESSKEIAQDILRVHELKYSQPEPLRKRVQIVNLLMPKQR